MPELPEVETVANALRPQLEGRTIEAVETSGYGLRTPVDLAGEPRVIGQRILAIRRRGKYIVVELGNVHGLLFHLGMTGSFRIEPADTAARKHDHVMIFLDDNRVWRFNDPRRFGRAECHELLVPNGLPACLDHLGPEPFSDDFSVAYLRQICSGRERPIKNLIMDSMIIVGVGNIYANEALLRAGIRPQTPAGRISVRRLRKLVAAILAVLSEAIEAGGTTISDFVTVDGSEGLFNRELRVYGRAGATCRCCERGIIRHLVMSGRATYYCPVCQS